MEEVFQMSTRKKILRSFEEKKDYMNDRIATGIEANRKGFAFLTLTDEKGEAVKNAEIKIIQKTHDFKYGANLFMLTEQSFHHKTSAADAIIKIWAADATDSMELEHRPTYWKIT